MNCEKCTFHKEEIDMVAPNVSGTVDACKKREPIREVMRGKECPTYKLKLWHKVLQDIGLEK